MSQHDETLSQHRRLRLVADRLRLLVMAPSEALPEPRMRSLFVAEVSHFADGLAAHFAHEEDGGYMRTVIVERPDLHETISALEGEHAELTRHISDVLAALERDAMAQIGAELRGMLDRFEAHERKENQLIQSTFNTDLGVGD